MASTSKMNLRKCIIIFWSVFGIGILFIILMFSLMANGKLGEMPSLEDLESPRNLIASEVISRDGVVMGRYFRENRTVAVYDELPTHLIDALIATEDARFKSHSGIDFIGLFRVIKGLLTGDSSSGGGSTISQQLAKMLFPRGTVSKSELVLRKFKEWIIAVKLEKNFTKQEIIAMYLNMYDFLNLAVGINSASRIYFSCEPKDLTVEQSAMLIGMAKNSALFNPIRRPEMTKDRRNVVLSQMEKYGYITQNKKDSLSKLPLELKFSKEDFKLGLAPYLREYIRTTLSAKEPIRKNYASWQTEDYRRDSIAWINDPLYGWCNKNKKENGENYNIYEDGLRIYTTIDSRMQKYGEDAVQNHLKEYLQPAFDKQIQSLKNPPFANRMSSDEADQIISQIMKQSERYRILKRVEKKNDNEIKKIFNTPVEMTIFSWNGDIDTIMSPIDSIKYTLSILRTSMMCMDNQTGQVRAYVGGPDYRYFMYDMVTKGRRQVGSTIKPFLYTLAMQNGYSPCTQVPNIPQTFILPDGRTWTPKNSDKSSYDGKMVSLQWGLANSVNYITAWIMKQFNPEAMINIMRKMGITSQMEAVPSICLGTPDISVCEMVGAYGTFGNKGIYTKPYFVSRIADNQGNILAYFTPQQQEAFDERTAYTMAKLLCGVIDRGTGRRLKSSDPIYGGLSGEFGGKTGTTQNQSDGWFMGETPQLTVGIWTGAEVRSIRFPSLAYGQGARMAMPVFGRFMKKVYADTDLEYNQNTKFEIPAGYNVDFNCINGQIKSNESDQDENLMYDLF